MILADQPTIFGDHVTAALSSHTDGTMKDGSSVTASDATQKNYTDFLARFNLTPADSTYMTITPDYYLTGTDFTRYAAVADADKGRDTQSSLTDYDGIATTSIGHALVIPPADCPVAVLYDPAHHALMLSHLGRHSIEQYVARESVDFMVKRFASDPGEILVWVSPAPNGEAYPMWAFDSRSMRDVVAEQLTSAGVLPAHIELSPVDTITNEDYFSHSEFLKGNRAEDGRYPVCAVLR